MVHYMPQHPVVYKPVSNWEDRHSREEAITNKVNKMGRLPAAFAALCKWITTQHNNIRLTKKSVKWKIYSWTDSSGSLPILPGA